MKGFLCKLILSCLGGGDAVEITPRAELAYGNVLYSYYQEDYDTALVDLRVARQQGHAEGVETEFALAEGSLAFSDRMFDYARTTFAAIDPAELTELDRLRLTFHSAREQFRVGDWERLRDDVERIDLGTQGLFGKRRFHPEVEFMRAELALRDGELDAARGHLDVLDWSEPLKSYGYFNLGSALRSGGETDAAAEAYAAVAKKKPKTVEQFDLQQRALLAGAYIERESGAVPQAEKILAKMPAAGRYRDLALASYGSLAMESGDYDLAARVWMTLGAEPLWTPSTATARLGFPLSLENMERGDLALAHYREAERSFAARAVKLDDLSRNVQDTGWVRELLDGMAGGQAAGALQPEIMQEWQERLGHTDWVQWLSSEGVHAILGEWRELRATQSWLAALPEDLATYRELAQEQRRRAGAINAVLADDGLVARHAEIEADVQAQLARWQRLSAADAMPETEWMLEFADSKQRGRLAQLDAMADFAATKMGPSEAGTWQLRIERLRSVIFWELADSRTVRLREMRAAIAEVEATSTQMALQAQRLQQAEAEYEAGLLTRFGVLHERAGEVAVNVEKALAVRETRLAQELRRGMLQEREQVQHYLVTARVAIARTLDRYASAGDIKSNSDVDSATIGGEQARVETAEPVESAERPPARTVLARLFSRRGEDRR